MRTRALLAAAVMIAAFASNLPARADDPVCTVAAGSATNQHIVDPANDYDSATRKNVPPYGDVNGSGNDLTGAWLSPDAAPTRFALDVNIQVAKITGTEMNAIAALTWDVTDASENVTTYYVQAENDGPALGLTFDYGTFDPLPTGGKQLRSLGTPTGFIDAANNAYVIQLKKSDVKKLGNPGGKDAAGNLVGPAAVDNLQADMEFLIGVLGTGSLPIVDDSTDADFACESVSFV